MIAPVPTHGIHELSQLFLCTSRTVINLVTTVWGADANNLSRPLDNMSKTCPTSDNYTATGWPCKSLYWYLTFPWWTLTPIQFCNYYSTLMCIWTTLVSCHRKLSMNGQLCAIILSMVFTPYYAPTTVQTPIKRIITV